MRFRNFLYEFMSSFQYIKNLVTSSNRDNYISEDRICKKMQKRGERKKNEWSKSVINTRPFDAFNNSA